MVDASAANYQLLEDSLWTLQTLRALATASGVQLDGIGQIVDLARNGLIDADYFTWLTAKILALSSDGSADRLLDIGALIAAGAWVFGEYFPASFLLTAPALMANAALVAEILSTARAGGVNGQMLYSLTDDADTFTFSGDDTEQASVAQGWSDETGVPNGDFGEWSGGLPSSWTVVGTSAGHREVTQVASGNAHGGGGSGACNLWSDSGTTPSIDQFIPLVIGQAYTITIVISYQSGGSLFIGDNWNNQFTGQFYTSTGTKTITFTATATSVDILATIGAAGNSTIDSISISPITIGGDWADVEQL